MLCMQKGDIKQAESYIARPYVRIADKNEAAAYLQLCSIMMTNESRAAKIYFFKKAKG